MARLGQAGVKVICYNFMPVFDWTRTDLAKPRFDGATVLAYDQSIIDRITDPQAFADRIQQGAGDFEMAGWEPERMAELEKLFAQYASVSHEDLFRNLQYFLKAVLSIPFVVLKKKKKKLPLPSRSHRHPVGCGRQRLGSVMRSIMDWS